VADIINIDDLNIYVVPQEIRKFVVTRESRRATIEQETRILKI